MRIKFSSLFRSLLIDLAKHPKYVTKLQFFVQSRKFAGASQPSIHGKISFSEPVAGLFIRNFFLKSRVVFMYPQVCRTVTKLQLIGLEESSIFLGISSIFLVLSGSVNGFFLV